MASDTPAALSWLVAVCRNEWKLTSFHSRAALRPFAVEPYLQKCAGVGIRQNFGVGERVNVGDDFARPRFDEAAGVGFAGGVLVFDCDGA